DGQPRRGCSRGGFETEAEHETFTRQELLALLPFRIFDPHGGNPDLAASPFLESCRPLGGLRLGGQQRVVASDRLGRRAVDLDPSLTEEDCPLAEALDGRSRVRDEE